MRVRRSGYERFQGYTDIITDREPKVVWNSNSKELCLQVCCEPNIYQSNVNYDYDVFLTLDELAAILAVVSTDAISAMPREIYERLRSSLPAIIQILACASGYNPVALPPAP